MTLPVPLRIAQRELRGGLKGFRVFLACLALGVAAIAAVGSVRESISTGLEREGASILGGDASITLTYRFAEEAERAWLDANAPAVSEIVDFRSMAVVPRGDEAERGLTQVKGVDAAYPLYGAMVLDPPVPLEQALAGQGGVPGAVMDPVLIARLGLEEGETFRLGTQDFVLAAAIVREPDAAEGGFGLGPRTLVLTADLSGSGLLQPGTLFDSQYRLRLSPDTDLDAFRAEAEAAFGPGIRWRDRRNGAPGVAEFVDRLGAFLVLVGLAGLAVGGVGVSAAVRSYLDEKTAVIATLKTLGAESRTIFLTYFAQIGVLTLLGVAVGLALGAVLPLALAPLIEARLPVPAVFAVHPGPLVEAAIYGLLAALLFTLWPLARTEEVRAAALFRDIAAPARTLPRPVWLITMSVIFAALVGLAALFSGLMRLTLWSAAGLVGAFVLLVLAAWGVRWLAARLARSRMLRGRTIPRLALGSVGGPGGEAVSVVLSLGLGLTVLAAVGQIDWNLRAAIERDLPDVAPSFFVVDIQNAQIDDFRAGLDANPAVTRVESAPMLRGVITTINGRPAAEVAGDHWVLEGDRGITYSAIPPEGTKITAGTWWASDHTGPAQISFAAEEAEEMGLSLGDTMTINVLGRDIEGRITSFREVDFSTAGIGFVLSMTPNALAGAPHTHIATIYADEDAEPALLRDLSNAYVNVTVIRVRDAIDRVAEVLAGIAAAVTYGALATLITGGIVLIGAAAAGERARTYEAAVLKTIGATRGAILANFALRSAILGAAAGAVAIMAGGLAGWAVTTFVMETEFRFEPVSAVTIVLGGIAATMLAGLAFAWRPLSRRPAGVLRARE
jgi:putative ABC transport system permease protein